MMPGPQQQSLALGGAPAGPPHTSLLHQPMGGCFASEVTEKALVRVGAGGRGGMDGDREGRRSPRPQVQ